MEQLGPNSCRPLVHRWFFGTNALQPTVAVASQGRALSLRVRPKAYCARLSAFVTGLSFYCHGWTDKGALLAVWYGTELIGDRVRLIAAEDIIPRDNAFQHAQVRAIHHRD